MPLDVIDIKTLFGSWPKLRLDVSPDDLVANMRPGHHPLYHLYALPSTTE